MVVPATLILAFLFANIVKSLGSRLSSFVKTSIYIPTIISGIVASVIFVFIFDYSGGLANYVIGLFGSEPKAWLADVSTALPSIVAPAVWLGFGLTALIMLAGLHDIPESYYEAADLEGAGTFAKMRYITIPLMCNVFLFLMVTGFTANISQYELSLVMTNGGPLSVTTTPNLYIFSHFRSDVMVGNSIAASLLLFIVLGSISAIIFRVLNSEKAVDG
jgi:multiple sugar transport system permease protein